MIALAPCDGSIYGHRADGGTPDQRLTNLRQLPLVTCALGMLERALEQGLARLDAAPTPVRRGDVAQRSRNARVVADALEDGSRTLRCLHHVVHGGRVGVDVRAKPRQIEARARLGTRVARLFRLCQRDLQELADTVEISGARAERTASSSRSSSRSGASSGSSSLAPLEQD